MRWERRKFWNLKPDVRHTWVSQLRPCWILRQQIAYLNTHRQLTIRLWHTCRLRSVVGTFGSMLGRVKGGSKGRGLMTVCLQSGEDTWNRSPAWLGSVLLGVCSNMGKKSSKYLDTSAQHRLTVAESWEQSRYPAAMTTWRKRIVSTQP